MSMDERVAQARRIQEAQTGALLERENVVGTGTGLRLRNGEITDEVVVTIAVRHKLPADQLSAAALLPSELPDPETGETIGVDVLEVGDIVPAVDDARYRPLQGGCSVSRDGSGETGTLGGFVVDQTDDAVVALSCNHVIAQNTPAGSPIIQPATDSTGVVGSLKRSVPITFGGPFATPTPVDAAIGRVSAARKNELLDVGLAAYEIEEPRLGTAVHKRGRTTGHTTNGVILVDNFTASIPYHFGGTAQITNSFIIQHTGAPFSLPGDSGALILNQVAGRVGGAFPVIGVLYGRSTIAPQTYANRISAVFRELNLTTLFGTRTIASGTWEPGWTTFSPFTLAGQPHYLAHNATNRQITIDRIRSDGKAVDTLYTETWSPGWTTLMPFTLAGQPYLLCYKKDSGQLSIERVAAGGVGTDTVFGDTWDRGWTLFSPFTRGAGAYYLAYKADTQHVAVDRIRPDGRGVDGRYAAVWNPGWTTLMPFTLRGRPHHLGYKRSTGEFTIERSHVNEA